MDYSEVEQLICILSKLVGGTVITVLEDNGYAGLCIRHDNDREFHIWFYRDPECNGPGWVTVERLV